MAYGIDMIPPPMTELIIDRAASYTVNPISSYDPDASLPAYDYLLLPMSTAKFVYMLCYENTESEDPFVIYEIVSYFSFAGFLFTF